MFWTRMKLAVAVAVAGFVCGGLGISVVGDANAAPAAGENPAPAGQPAGLQVLNNDSYYRAHVVFRTPVVITASGELKTAIDPSSREKKPFADFQSPLPPGDWAGNQFDDSPWNRVRAPFEIDRGGGQNITSNPERFRGPANSLLYVRGKFVVDDPAKVADLKLTVEYVGGVAVYVNGQELKRGHLPAGELKPDTLAERYPDDLYCDPTPATGPDGAPVVKYLDNLQLKDASAVERRFRRLPELAVPATLLRKGINVLAIEIHRAPLSEAAIAARHTNFAGSPVFPGMWAYAGLRSVSLTAAPGAAVASNVARPNGIEVWSPRSFDTVTVSDYGGTDAMTQLAEAGPVQTRPVVVTAARNGVFSGRVVVSSGQAIKGLKATVSDLVQAGGDGKIAASAVGVRYAELADPAKSWAPTIRFDGLLEAIPAEIPVAAVKLPAETCMGFWNDLGFTNGGVPVHRTGVAAGALAPLWLTVRVPKDAKPGKYEGTVTVSADGLKPTPVPLRVVVSAWVVPDPKDFVGARNLIFCSEDSLAICYKVDRWSERHLELMSKSLAMVAELGSRLANVNLAINFHSGDSNAESMVRWIKQTDGSFKYDFTPFDKYLDMVAKTIGKPLPLRLNCWGELNKEGKNGSVPTVSLLDPASGKLTPMDQPTIGTEESFAFWKPVLDETRKRIEARGWFDVTSVGHNSYCTAPRPEVVEVFKRIWPDGVWSGTSHNSGLGNLFGKTKAVAMPMRYAEALWTGPVARMRGYRELLKPRQGSFCRSPRELMHPRFPLTNVADQYEGSIMGGGNGLGDFGADLFPYKPKPDSRYYSHISAGRGTGGPNYTSALLFPGPDGPTASERFEAYRESVERCEAAMFIERALADKKISGDLEQRANRCLDDRCTAFLKRWWWPNGRYERDTELLTLAGEVAAASGPGR